jgi:DNA-directed RNA polymerase subunit M/transcription elongation factor TFIIS
LGKSEETTPARSALTDPRLERLLTLAQEINDFHSKIQTATKFLSGKASEKDLESVTLARDELYRQLAATVGEAHELSPVLDEIALKLQEQIYHLEKERKMSLGLAKIEGLRGTKKVRELVVTAAALETQISEVQNLIAGLDAFSSELSTRRREPITCPRCASNSVAYRISPSEFGFTLYRCNQCGNAWKITAFSVRVG